MSAVKNFLKDFLMKGYNSTTLSIRTLSITTFSITTFGITTFGITTFGIMTFGITTFGITTFGIMALSITTNKKLYALLLGIITQHYGSVVMLCHLC